MRPPQGKIKGSYTADKMIEFCRRGTLSANQLVLGIDKDLPYALRQVSIRGRGRRPSTPQPRGGACGGPKSTLSRSLGRASASWGTPSALRQCCWHEAP
jgi:hypothetical protein